MLKNSLQRYEIISNYLNSTNYSCSFAVKKYNTLLINNLSTTYISQLFTYFCASPHTKNGYYGDKNTTFFGI